MGEQAPPINADPSLFAHHNDEPAISDAHPGSTNVLVEQLYFLRLHPRRSHSWSLLPATKFGFLAHARFIFRPMAVGRFWVSKRKSLP